MDKQHYHNILVVGTPRCGMTYIYQVLIRLLSLAEHERYNDNFTIHNICSWSMPVKWDSGGFWKGLLDLKKLHERVTYKDFRIVFHLVRNPLKTISSLHMMPDWFWKKIKEIVDVPYNPDKKNISELTYSCAKFWLDWNLLCEQVSHKRIKLEDISVSDKFYDFYYPVVNKPVYNIDFNYNTKDNWTVHKDRYKDVSIDMLYQLDDKQLVHNIVTTSIKYGYEIMK